MGSQWLGKKPLKKGSVCITIRLHGGIITFLRVARHLILFLKKRLNHRGTEIQRKSSSKCKYYRLTFDSY